MKYTKQLKPTNDNVKNHINNRQIYVTRVTSRTNSNSKKKTYEKKAMNSSEEKSVEENREHNKRSVCNNIYLDGFFPFSFFRSVRFQSVQCIFARMCIKIDKISHTQCNQTQQICSKARERALDHIQKKRSAKTKKKIARQQRTIKRKRKHQQHIISE